MKNPDIIKKISINNQKVTLFQFNSEVPSREIKAKLIGSVNQVIECDVQLSDLYSLSPKKIPYGTFGFGAAAQEKEGAILRLGEAFGMNERFFLADPYKVSPNDPYICVKNNIVSPFFFYADLNFGFPIPKFEIHDNIPILKGDIHSGVIYKFKSSSSIQIANILEKLTPIGLSVTFFRGRAYAKDIVDKLLKKSPIIKNKKPYGKINTQEGLKEFFVMHTIPAVFHNLVEIIAIGVAIKFNSTSDSQKNIPISNKTLKNLFYFTPGTVKSSVWNNHMHGLILGYEDSAVISPQDSIDLNQIPLNEIDSEKNNQFPLSGRIVHLENTSKILSGAFKIVKIAELEHNI